MQYLECLLELANWCLFSVNFFFPFFVNKSLFLVFIHYYYSSIFAVIMKWNWIIFLISIVFNSISCSNNNTSLSIQNNNPTDSTAYFDSINQPLRTKIDSFFSSKHKKGIFNGNVLFALNNKTIFKKAYGVSNLKKKASVKIV